MRAEGGHMGLAWCKDGVGWVNRLVDKPNCAGPPEATRKSCRASSLHAHNLENSTRDRDARYRGFDIGQVKLGVLRQEPVLGLLETREVRVKENAERNSLPVIPNKIQTKPPGALPSRVADPTLCTCGRMYASKE